MQGNKISSLKSTIEHEINGCLEVFVDRARVKASTTGLRQQCKKGTHKVLLVLTSEVALVADALTPAFE